VGEFQFFNTGYEVLFSGISAALIAQVIKVITYLCIHKKINFKIFTTTGGMPSSHTAGVVAMATAVGLIEGISSISFAIAIGFSLVVMQDAAGVRRAAGKTAATLNRLVEEFIQRNHEVKPYATLKELLGHTPLEVFCGMLLGIALPIAVHYCIKFFPSLS